MFDGLAHTRSLPELGIATNSDPILWIRTRMDSSFDLCIGNI
jgi:hypothetical protein